jgi:hypothetical protein
VHLAGIGVGELADLEVDDDQAAEATVKEEEVDSIPLVADAEAALAADEGELAAELEQEGLEVVDERFLQVVLGILVLEAEELQDQRVAHLVVGREGITGLGLPAPGEHGGLVPGKGGALVELRGDLSVELTDRPAAPQGFGVIEVQCFARARSADEQDVVRPGQRECVCQDPDLGLPNHCFGIARRCRANRRRYPGAQFARQCRANLLQREPEIELPETLQVGTRKAPAESPGEIGRQLLQQRRPVFRTCLATLLELDDPPPDFPVGRGHQRIDGAG